MPHSNRKRVVLVSVDRIPRTWRPFIGQPEASWSTLTQSLLRYEMNKFMARLRTVPTARVTQKVEPKHVQSRRLEEICADYLTCQIRLNQLKAKKEGNEKDPITGKRIKGGLDKDALDICRQHGADSHGHVVVNEKYYVQ